jgi:hypothetical protein
MPDGLFSNPKSQFGSILEGLAMENVGMHILCAFGILYGHWKYFIAIWYILWTFDIFSPFWYVVPRKIWQPCRRRLKYI